MEIASVCHDLFPKVDKLLSEYLTPHILSAVRFEIAQCLYFIASKVESNIIEDPSVSITDGCIEDKYDAKQTLLKSMIAEVGEERVCELWKIMDVRPDNKKHIHFVIIIDTVSYLCLCMSNISCGIVCR
ncbi:unnamed protein product [Rhizophagus irregularis]|nr:unnamed protein product [Rhizophagus irregularis]